MNKSYAQSFALGLALVLSAQTYVCAKPAPHEQVDAADATDCQVMKLGSGRNKFGHHALTIRIRIDAPVDLVYEAIRENRLADPDVAYSKFTQLTDAERILEQKYVALPIFGSTTCTLKLTEIQNKSIDYNLLKSDRLSEFEGSWVLTPSEDSHSTVLELSNHMKLNLPVPQRIIDAFAAPKMKTRVLFVKNLAESRKQTQIASKN